MMQWHGLDHLNVIAIACIIVVAIVVVAYQLLLVRCVRQPIVRDLEQRIVQLYHYHMAVVLQVPSVVSARLRSARAR